MDHTENVAQISKKLATMKQTWKIWVTFGKMCHTCYNGSPLQKWLTLRKLDHKYKNRSAMRTWGLMLKFIPFGWNAILTYQCLEAELLQAKR